MKKTAACGWPPIWSYRHSIWGSKSGGNSPETCGQLVLASSDDDGLTWSKPVNITEQTKDKGWRILFNGPGNGICMKDGTLVFAAQYWDGKGSAVVHDRLFPRPGQDLALRYGCQSADHGSAGY